MINLKPDTAHAMGEAHAMRTVADWHPTCHHKDGTPRCGHMKGSLDGTPYCDRLEQDIDYSLNKEPIRYCCFHTELKRTAQ